MVGKGFVIPENEWKEMTDFVSEFNAYEHWGSFAKTAKVAGQSDPKNPIVLRTKMFYTLRCYASDRGPIPECEWERLKIQKALVTILEEE